SFAQPLEDKVRVHIVAPRHLADRDAGHPRLGADHPLLVVAPDPALPALNHVVASWCPLYTGGHYRPRSPLVRAVGPDAYSENAGALHPSNAAGTFGYHEGVASLRQEFIGEQWIIDRKDGV